MANNDLSPYDKVQAWFKMARREGYDAHDAILSQIMTLESVVYEYRPQLTPSLHRLSSHSHPAYLALRPTPTNPNNVTTVFTFTVPRSLCNLSGNLHGGAVALIFDICTSTSISACAKDGFWNTGHVSRTLNCTYLRPAPLGAKVTVESQVVHLGKRLGMTTGVIKTEDGKVCYTCEHGKAATGAASL